MTVSERQAEEPGCRSTRGVPQSGAAGDEAKDRTGDRATA